MISFLLVALNLVFAYQNFKTRNYAVSYFCMFAAGFCLSPALIEMFL